MADTLKICKRNVNGTGYCDIFDDYCHEGPCSHETLVEYVAVVRCRDCKYSYEDISGRCCSHGPCKDWVVLDDSFCSQGERRGGDNGSASMSDN